VRERVNHRKRRRGWVAIACAAIHRHHPGNATHGCNLLIDLGYNGSVNELQIGATELSEQPVQTEMLMSAARGGGPASRLVGLEQAFGWTHHVFPGFSVWFCGHLYDHADPIRALSSWPVSGSDTEIARFLDGLDGHFALICAMPGRQIAAVDPVRSVPLFFADHDGATWISASSEKLRVTLGLHDLDREAAVPLAMSGYTVGTRTLFRGLQQFAPGEFLVAADRAKPRRVRYHRYAPWQVQEDDDQAFEARLADNTLSLIERMARQAGGRLIAVPLSAGRDSRLVASALAETGARNVLCFSYGLPGSHEAMASRTIATKLGYDWHFVPFTPRSQRRFWSSELNARYQDFADSNCSTTVVHDLPAIHDLLERRVIDRQSIIVNGNSGDYISGLHIQPPVNQVLPDLDYEAAVDTVVSTLIRKHFRLWESLATAENDRRVASQLRAELDELDIAQLGADQIHGLYEYLEFQDRQSKYVISRQRIYEFLGVEWRLPLWSRTYLDFWQSVPLRLKRGQSLYARMLNNSNWGGVWQGQDWSFPRYVSPPWMRHGVRPLAMALCLPFGKSNWHRFERRFLSYWMDLFALQAIESYPRIAFDRRGARHLVAWHTEAYLRRKRVAWDGRPL
jgi:asparagine synthase (glutamine-hydrolysing)